MLEEDRARLMKCSIGSLTAYCNIMKCAIEFSHGGREVLVIPPGCE